MRQTSVYDHLKKVKAKPTTSKGKENDNESEDSSESSSSEDERDEVVTMSSLKELFKTMGFDTLKEEVSQLKEIRKDLQEVKDSLTYTERSIKEANDKAIKAQKK